MLDAGCLVVVVFAFDGAAVVEAGFVLDAFVRAGAFVPEPAFGFAGTVAPARGGLAIAVSAVTGRA